MMRIRHPWMFVLCLAALTTFVSCSSKHSISQKDANRIQELGNRFVEELNEIIPLREQPDDLRALEAVAVINEKTYHLSRLDAFYEDYRVGQDTELVLIFSSKSFVVNKIVFEGSSGYYFRYEFDPFDEKAINVTSQTVDRVSIAEEHIGDVRKVTLTLKKEKASDVLFTFKNIIEDGEEP